MAGSGLTERNLCAPLIMELSIFTGKDCLILQQKQEIDAFSPDDENDTHEAWNNSMLSVPHDYTMILAHANRIQMS